MSSVDCNIMGPAASTTPAAAVAPAKKKVMIVTLDTGTSERWAVETEVDEITPGQIIKAYETELAKAAGEMAPEYPKHQIRWWLSKGDSRVPGGPHFPAAFIMETHDPYFGPIRVIGFVEEVKGE